MPPTRPDSRPSVCFARAWGWLAASALTLAAAGVVLPLLPTTPFVLLALWASARGAPELNAKIRSHPRYRELIHAWENGRGIPRRAKIVAIALLAISWLGLWLGGMPAPVLMAVGVAFGILLIVILTRPEPEPADE